MESIFTHPDLYHRRPITVRRHDSKCVRYNLAISNSGNNIDVTTKFNQQDGGEWGEAAQLARCCRRVEFGAIAN
ncbi:unnamed protein product [Danaus chrysippus]|uniref:(African queen) hypothetical protein n=1 Tax=Danaus chrysippus TaxID=151541 RepID=A0A8J2R6Y9_9NEOP|nr:unnamed protein product [Danaus chrysippus]